MGEAFLRKIEKKKKQKLEKSTSKNILGKEQIWKRGIATCSKAFPSIVKTLFGGQRQSLQVPSS